MVDVNKPVTNPSVVLAIKNMQENNTSFNQAQFIAEVMKAHFISPVSIFPLPEPSDAEGKVVLKEKTTINFNIIENTANQKFFMAFTDWEELSKWHKSENQQTLIMTFDDYAAMVLDENGNSDGFVINPFGGNIIFSKDMIKDLKLEKDRRENGGVVPQVISKDTSVKIGEPSIYPYEMVKAISGYLKQNKNVQAAYLKLMLKEGEESYLVIVDFTGDRRQLFDGIAKVAIPHLKNMFIDMVPFDSDFGKNAANNTQPFYKRKTLGIF